MRDPQGDLESIYEWWNRPLPTFETEGRRVLDPSHMTGRQRAGRLMNLLDGYDKWRRRLGIEDECEPQCIRDARALCRELAEAKIAVTEHHIEVFVERMLLEAEIDETPRQEVRDDEVA